MYKPAGGLSEGDETIVDRQCRAMLSMFSSVIDYTLAALAYNDFNENACAVGRLESAAGERIKEAIKLSNVDSPVSAEMKKVLRDFAHNYGFDGYMNINEAVMEDIRCMAALDHISLRTGAGSYRDVGFET